jgi:molybdopterin converting factor small subunit
LGYPLGRTLKGGDEPYYRSGLTMVVPIWYAIDLLLSKYNLSWSKPIRSPFCQNMSVQINIPLFLQHLTNGVTVAKVNGSTVGDCLNHFIEQFPSTKEVLFDKDGKMLAHLDVYVNGRSSYPEELMKQVNHGDEISFLYLITGG